jgi:hypothetical protein
VSRREPRPHERHARHGDLPEADLEDGGLSDDRAGRGRNREDRGAGAELQGRIAEHPLRVEREDERHTERDRAEEEHHEIGGDERPRAEQAERDEWRAVARLDHREGGEEHGRAGEQEERLGLSPADVRRLDERVHE